MLVRTEGIVTQLVFDHALRIRMKAETSASPSPSRATTAAQTPDNASIAEAEESTVHGSPSGSNASGEETVRNSTISTASTAATKKGKEPPAKKSEDAPAALAEPSTGSGNLIGKINNLVTTDLNNLVDGRDFLFIGTSLLAVELLKAMWTERHVLAVLYAPLQVVLSIVFLYSILGWSAFVGMVAMLLLFPVPGYVASMIQGVQTEKMKKVRDTVDTLPPFNR